MIVGAAERRRPVKIARRVRDHTRRVRRRRHAHGLGFGAVGAIGEGAEAVEHLFLVPAFPRRQLEDDPAAVGPAELRRTEEVARRIRNDAGDGPGAVAARRRIGAGAAEAVDDLFLVAHRLRVRPEDENIARGVPEGRGSLVKAAVVLGCPVETPPARQQRPVGGGAVGAIRRIGAGGAEAVERDEARTGRRQPRRERRRGVKAERKEAEDPRGHPQRVRSGHRNSPRRGVAAV